MKALIARKIGMTSVIGDNGASVAVTLLAASPNTITQIKTAETDGYSAVQLGFETDRKPNKAQTGHYQPAKATPKISREFRVDEITEAMRVGAISDAGIFNVGDEVDVMGLSKGKGFAGTIKRHNFHRGRKTHGGRSYRRPGSIGSMYPQRIFPGKKMAGQMGGQRVTVKRLKVALIDKELGVIGIAGAVPGPRQGIIMLKGTNR